MRVGASPGRSSLSGAGQSQEGAGRNHPCTVPTQHQGPPLFSEAGKNVAFLQAEVNMSDLWAVSEWVQAGGGGGAVGALGGGGGLERE